MNELYELADWILDFMYKSPLESYSTDDICESLGCTEYDAKKAITILLSREYARIADVDPKFSVPEKIMLRNLGGDFYISGGFKELMRRESLMIENVEASIRAAKVSESVAALNKRVSIITLVIAGLTLLVLVIQVFLPFLC